MRVSQIIVTEVACMSVVLHVSVTSRVLVTTRVSVASHTVYCGIMKLTCYTNPENPDPMTGNSQHALVDMEALLQGLQDQITQLQDQVQTQQNAINAMPVGVTPAAPQNLIIQN